MYEWLANRACGFPIVRAIFKVQKVVLVHGEGNLRCRFNGGYKMHDSNSLWGSASLAYQGHHGENDFSKLITRILDAGDLLSFQ